MTSLYLHIPFCISKCHYCSFGSTVASGHLHGQYVKALEKELNCIADKYGRLQLDTLFLGGGTPTCLSSRLLIGLLSRCRDLFDFSEQAEVSVEANPGKVDENTFSQLLEVGVNRLSFGVQSFHDTELQLLGRIHSEQEAKDAVRMALKSGFTNINVDLMYGFPGQTPSSWKQSLGVAISLAIPHLSLYQLSVEPGTVMFQRVKDKASGLPDETAILEMDSISEEFTTKAGFTQYEISNYAREGYQCRHNLNYWYNKEYYAAGALAVSYLLGVRCKRVATPEAYIGLLEKNGDPVVDREKLSMEASFRETVVMGLRLVQGVSRETLLARFGIDLWQYYRGIIDKYEEFGFLEVEGEYLRLSSKGRSLGNMVMAEFV